MRHSKLSSLVRACGYEALFLLAVAMRPTIRNAEYLEGVFAELRDRRNVADLVGRGLIRSETSGTKDVLKLTELGQAVFEGGRRPEDAWAREWDGQWRLLTFDLPRKEGKARLRFWRWLRANHFGRIQGSVWVTPDPVPVIESTAEKAGFDPSNVLIFTGDTTHGLPPRELAAKAWDFGEINENHRSYREFAGTSLSEIRGKTLTLERLGVILAKDLELWRKAMRLDPLLPKPILPRQYEGVLTWKTRKKFHKALVRNLKFPDRT